MPAAVYFRDIAAFDAAPSSSDPPRAYARDEVLAFPSGDVVRVLVDSRASAGALAVLDCRHVAGPTERHIHADAQKSVFVIAGRYRFAVGDDVIEVGPGDNVHIPRGVAHDFVVGIEGGRALFVFAPVGVEEYFREIAVMASEGSSPATVETVRRRHHIEPVGGADSPQP